MVELSPVFCTKLRSLLLRGVLIPDDPSIITPTIRDAILQGIFEAEEAEAVPHIVRPDDVILEIGAGLGFISTLLSRQPDIRRIIAAEANPLLMDYMARLHAENGVSLVERLNVVLTNGRETHATFYIRKDFWMGSLMAEPNPYLSTVTVPTRGLNDLLREEGVTLIVCDVEGAEAFLFDQADLGTVDRLFIELHDHVSGLAGVAAVFRALGERGFAYDPRHSTGSVVLFQKVHRNEVLRPYSG